MNYCSEKTNDFLEDYERKKVLVRFLFLKLDTSSPPLPSLTPSLLTPVLTNRQGSEHARLISRPSQPAKRV